MALLDRGELHVLEDEDKDENEHEEDDQQTADAAEPDLRETDSMGDYY